MNNSPSSPAMHLERLLTSPSYPLVFRLKSKWTFHLAGRWTRWRFQEALFYQILENANLARLICVRSASAARCVCGAVVVGCVGGGGRGCVLSFVSNRLSTAIRAAHWKFEVLGKITQKKTFISWPVWKASRRRATRQSTHCHSHSSSCPRDRRTWISSYRGTFWTKVESRKITQFTSTSTTWVEKCGGFLLLFSVFHANRLQIQLLVAKGQDLLGFVGFPAHFPHFSDLFSICWLLMFQRNGPVQVPQQESDEFVLFRAPRQRLRAVSRRIPSQCQFSLFFSFYFFSTYLLICSFSVRGAELPAVANRFWLRIDLRSLPPSSQRERDYSTSVLA